MYNLMIVLGTTILKVYALPVENIAKSIQNILIRSLKDYNTICNLVEMELNIKTIRSDGGQLAIINSRDVFSHILTLRKDTDASVTHHNVLVIGDKNINNMSNDDIDSLVARLQQTAMEDFNKPLNKKK